MSSRESDEWRALGPALTPEAEGWRADLYLAHAFPFRSRTAWREMCRLGHLHVNGRTARPSHRLKHGDLLTVYHPLTAEPKVDTAIRVLAERDGIMAIYKPATLPMHEAGPFRRRTFTALVTQTFGAEWGAVHRLDRETSGVVVCASTYALRSALCAAFRTQTVEKTYVAILTGQIDWDERVVDAPLALKTRIPRPRFVAREGGLPARTHFKVLARKSTKTLVEVRPYTGRTHQIRVHAELLGAPVLGDTIYHPEGRTSGARLALHAQKVVFTKIPDSLEFAAEAPVPDDFMTLWESC